MMDAREKSMSPAEEQALAERAAFRKVAYDDKDVPGPLFKLVAAALADTFEDSFLESALEQLAGDLEVLHAACSDEDGSLSSTRFGLIEKLPMLIWRLANRARAILEIEERRKAVTRLERQDLVQLPKAVA